MMKKLFHHKNASTYGDKSVKNRKKTDPTFDKSSEQDG